MRILKVVSRIVGVGNKFVAKKQVKVDKMLSKEIVELDIIFKVLDKVEEKVAKFQDKGRAKRNEIRKDISFLTKILAAVENAINEAFEDEAEEPKCNGDCANCTKCNKEVEDED